jgi:enoyl-CoA hydratase/carnithine racemase
MPVVPDTSEVRSEDVGGGVWRVWLDRPERLNAYTPRMCRELRAVIDAYDRDDSARALIMTGSGRAFCAGGDIGGDNPELERELDGQMGRAQNLKHDMHALGLDMLRLDKPVIAAINGVAVAGGLTLALFADIRVAGAGARIGDTSGKVGLLADEGGAWLFPRLMGYEAAYRMVALSEIYDAERARALGLVSEVVSDGALQDHVLELAREFAGRSPVALRVTKRLMRDALASGFEQSLSDAALAVMFVNTGQDAQEGMQAFRERRAPRFEGR